jgi:imidazolonepropionase-like amidohydrolase
MSRFRLRCVGVLGLLSVAFVSAPTQAEDKPETITTTVIYCGSLLDVPGEPERGASTIIIENDRIVSVLDGRVEREHTSDNVVVYDFKDATIIPGLIDCHTHLTHEMKPGSRLARMVSEDADAAIHAVAYARRTIEAGFTTVRNVGSGGQAIFALRDGINRGDIVGPRIFAAGHAITPTGGHGDGTHGFAEDIFEIPGAYQGVADGADECRKAVRAQVKRGADCIKLTATGGVLSNTNAGTNQQFFEDELEAIVETAHALGRNVAAHAHGTDGINAALRAGVDSIEHGSFLDDESISLFKRTGAFLVPTILAGVTVTEIAAGENNYFTPEVTEKALAVGPVMQENLGWAHREGVRIAFGTDSGVSKHGDNAREFLLMVEAGMTPEEAIHAATVNAAELCGQSENIGTLEPGKYADFVVYISSPLDGINAILKPHMVFQGGRPIGN